MGRRGCGDRPAVEFNKDNNHNDNIINDIRLLLLLLYTRSRQTVLSAFDGAVSPRCGNSHVTDGCIKTIIIGNGRSLSDE